MNQIHSACPSKSLRANRDDLEQEFLTRGYLSLPGVVGTSTLSELREELSEAFASLKAQGQLFEGGGTVSGHLNCFPGYGARGVYEALETSGVIELVRALSREGLRLPNVGCNFNLPLSSAQNEHVDGYAATPFLIVNVAVVDTSLANGAMEIMPHTHLRNYKYWQLLSSRPERLRLCMARGDVVIRTSALWHRGMPNRTREPRPMLAFTWEDGGSKLADPFSAHDGQIRFLPNRFRTDLLGRLRERAFVAAPRLGRAVRAARSLFAG